MSICLIQNSPDASRCTKLASRVPGMRCSDRPMLSVDDLGLPGLDARDLQRGRLALPAEDEQHQLIGIHPGVIAHGIDVSEDQLR